MTAAGIGRSLLVGLCGLAALGDAEAFAQDRAACFDAVSRGQVSRDAHKLIEARNDFRVCAQLQCPDSMRGDCAEWLLGVENSLPTVVFSVKDTAGADLVAVTVRVDGQPLLTRLDGMAVPLNPGLHTFRFEAAGTTSLDKQLVLKEGEKDLPLAVVLVPVADRGAPPATAPRAAIGRGSGDLATLGWAACGVGAAGLAIGTISGVVAIAAKDSAHCDSQHLCDASPLRDSRTAAVVSDVALVAGGVLAAGGLVLVLIAPRFNHERSAASLSLAPILAPSTGGVSLEGAW